MKKIIKKYWWAILIVIIWGPAIWRMLYLHSIGYGWVDSGFTGKTWWDVLELLIIPLTLAVLAIVIEYYERKEERRLNLDNQRERLVQNYFDAMTGLILEKNLKDSKPNDVVREIARIKTLTTLKRLDIDRKSSILEFLCETELVQGKNKVDPIIGLANAELERVGLAVANLVGADLSYANLKDAELLATSLDGTDLRRTNLNGACLWIASLESSDLEGASLRNANLKNANLKDANLKDANLKDADFTDAIMPDGKKYDPNIHTIEYMTGSKQEDIEKKQFIRD